MGQDDGQCQVMTGVTGEERIEIEMPGEVEMYRSDGESRGKGRTRCGTAVSCLPAWVKSEDL